MRAPQIRSGYLKKGGANPWVDDVEDAHQHECYICGAWWDCFDFDCREGYECECDECIKKQKEEIV